MVDRVSDIQINSIFGLCFPIPVRVTILILLGIWGWGVNVHACRRWNVDVETMIKYNSNGDLHYAIYRFALSLSIYTFTLLGFFWYLLGDVTEEGHTAPFGLAEYIPWVMIISLVGIIAYPGRRFHGKGRHRFRLLLVRIIRGGLDKDCRILDVIASDALTSYTKVLVDIVIMLSMWGVGNSCLEAPDRSFGGKLFIPLVSMVPYLIRLKQCFIDYDRTSNYQHIYNAIKYGTSFPCVILGTIYKYSDENRGFYWLWILALLINSIYSFIWDVTYDWNLNLLSSFISGVRIIPSGLRQVLFFRSPAVYYSVIATDLVLRFLWLWPLLSSWPYSDRIELGLFFLTFMEILRRWLWIFFRLEAEWIVAIDGSGTMNNHMEPDNIPLKELSFDSV